MKRLNELDGVEMRAADGGAGGHYETWRGPVAYLCRRLMEARGLGLVLWTGEEISRRAVLAAASEVRLRRRYDPAMDRRLAWLRAVAAERNGAPAGLGQRRGDLQAVVEWLVYPPGGGQCEE
jgi:hypothetical protein